MSRPIQVIINITEQCNLHCKHCSAWQKNASGQEKLTTDEWKQVFTDLREWIGTFQLVFSGGEPFLCPDICELIRFCSNMDIVTTVVSNGTLLDEQQVAEVARARLDNLVISLDGARAETHDYIRGREGTYRKVMAAIERIIRLERRPSLTITTVILSQNLDELIDLVRTVREKELAAIIFQVMIHDFWGSSQPSNSAWYVDHKLWVKNTDKVCALLDRLIELKDMYPIANPADQLQVMKQYFQHPEQPLQGQRCLVGARNLFLSPNGDFSLCFHMMPLGNVKTVSPRLAWHSKVAHQQRLAIKRCHRSCLLLNCNYPTFW